MAFNTSTASKTFAQLYHSEATNNQQRANPYNKIAFQVQHGHNTNQTQNKTNVYTDGLNIERRPIGETVNRNFQGLKVVRPLVGVDPVTNDGANAYKWTFNGQNSTMKAPFSEYNLPRSREPTQYVGV